MSNHVRKVDQTYEACDWCEEEIRVTYDSKLMSLWPLLNPGVGTGGFLENCKYLLANFGRQTAGEPSYIVHTKCAQKMISWAMNQKSLSGPERLEQYGAKASHKEQSQ